MQRFQNPHPSSGHMHTMNQQQQMHPMQQNTQGGGPIPLPNGMIMLPNGMVVTPQQAQALMGSMQPTMNSNIPINMMPMGGVMPVSTWGLPTNTGRFSNQNQTVFGGISGTATPDNEFLTDSRFQSTNTQIRQPMNEQSRVNVTPALFSILVAKGVMFTNNTKVILNSYCEEIKPSQIYVRENYITLVECFEEAIESCIGTSYESGENKLITVGEFLIENSFYKAAGQEQFNKIVLDNDIKTMYKAMKISWPTLNNKYDIYMFDRFDTIMTDMINDFIAINSPIEVHIDSFMSDFNDLLKFLRNLENCNLDLEDELITYMNNYITAIKTNLEINQSQLIGIDAEEDKRVTYIPEQCLIAYVDKYSHELGVTKVPDKLTKVDNNILNVFLLSLAKAIMSNRNIFTFYMVTINKSIIQFTKALNGDIFIKKI